MEKGNIQPPFYLFLSLITTVLLHFFIPIKQIIQFPYRLIGAVFALLGICLNIWTDGLFKKKGTTVKSFRESSAFITEGPFEFTRHPMYLGMVCLVFGLSVILGSITAFLPPLALFIFIDLAFVRGEERTMAKTFGDEYRDYSKRVRRWI